MSSFVAGRESSINRLRTLDNGMRSPKGRRAVLDIEILISWSKDNLKWANTRWTSREGIYGKMD
ncbi:uncharacterized protein BT62DRAFT_937590, partial [Guyanagaster necrorhizus]